MQSGDETVFAQKAEALFRGLGEHRIMVLATAEGGLVTARSMSCIIFDQKFYFQTDITMTKAKQMAANPNVALCHSNYQIEGGCRETGHPLDEANRRFLALYRKHYEGSYRKYSLLENERVYEISPVRIAVWDYEDGTPFQDFYDFTGRTYRREYYGSP